MEDSITGGLNYQQCCCQDLLKKLETKTETFALVAVFA